MLGAQKDGVDEEAMLAQLCIVATVEVTPEL